MFTHSQVQIFYDEKLLNVTSVRLSAANWLLERLELISSWRRDYFVFNESEMSIEY